MSHPWSYILVISWVYGTSGLQHHLEAASIQVDYSSIRSLARLHRHATTSTPQHARVAVWTNHAQLRISACSAEKSHEDPKTSNSAITEVSVDIVLDIPSALRGGTREGEVVGADKDETAEPPSLRKWPCC